MKQKKPNWPAVLLLVTAFTLLLGLGGRWDHMTYQEQQSNSLAYLQR